MALRIVVLLSGSGTTLENLIEWRAKGQLDIEIVAVVSSKPSAFGLERARRHGLATHAVDRRAYRDERGFNNALHRILDEYQPQLLVLAGFLTRLELRGYSGRTMNVHPALVPAFSGKGYYGERVFRAVLESAVKLTGVTVHFCDDEYDTGPIILQEAVAVEDDDSVDSLARRVQEKERDLYPRAIQLYAEGRLQLQGRRVRILPPAPERTGP
ncbi:MAG: phosphoribosylglycinamide formyltransferase [Deltaproteobacteria bacterium]|nr:MAG: phosphoribosylglycinamide formyltransferase [Deltaproteobacteria bacterium]